MTTEKSRQEENGEKRRYWKEHLDAWRASGLSQVEYCRQHDLSRFQFQYWKRRFQPSAAFPSFIELPLSQLNRRLETRENKKPQLSDLRESGSIEQDADLVMLIYRDEVYHPEADNPNIGKAEIILSKHRNGPTGKVDLAFLNIYTRFENLTLM
jgi:hypothetical protein